VWDSVAAGEAAERLVVLMSDEELLAQTFMLGWTGAEPSPEILQWIQKRAIGGIKVFGWNASDTTKLSQTIRQLQHSAADSSLGIPLLVATDQEGGTVRHVRGETSHPPSNMAIGASGRPIDAYWSGYYIGRELSLLGINMNFAPALDLYGSRESALIGTRSFGNDPALAGILGAAFARGQRDAGIIATVKHFPGHGGTPLDSHGTLPYIDSSFDTLWNRDLLPFRLAVKERIPAIMSGHLAFPATAGGRAPASLSPWFLSEVLRDRMGFQGLVITDDLFMRGALQYAQTAAQAAKAALSAGNDMILLSRTPELNDAVWTRLLSATKSDPVFRQRLKDACLRIITLKLEYLKERSPTTGDIPISSIRHPDSAAFFAGLAARSVTIAHGRNILPLNPDSSGAVLLAGSSSEFFVSGTRAFPRARSYWYSLGAAAGTAQALAAQMRSADTVIFCLADQRGLMLLQEVRRLLDMSRKTLIVLSVSNPVYLDKTAFADASIAVYSATSESFAAAFSAILGKIPAEGKLPFPINGAIP